MYKSSYDEWLSALPEGSPLKKELEDIEGDEAAIEERFYRELEFGTAGLRGILGAGTNRMNEYVVRRATRGLAAYLLGFDGAKERGVCIAYDSRRFSKELRGKARGRFPNTGCAYIYSIRCIRFPSCRLR